MGISHIGSSLDRIFVARRQLITTDSIFICSLSIYSRDAVFHHTPTFFRNTHFATVAYISSIVVASLGAEQRHYDEDREVYWVGNFTLCRTPILKTSARRGRARWVVRTSFPPVRQLYVLSSSYRVTRSLAAAALEKNYRQGRSDWEDCGRGTADDVRGATNKP